MKMTFTIFLGALVLLAGLSILLDAVFHIHFPFVRTAFAFLLLFFGVRMLLGAWAPAGRETSTTGSAIMSDQTYAPTAAVPYLKYDVIFGRTTVDLTSLPRPTQPITVEVNAIFGGAVVTFDKSWPVVVEGNAAFGDVRMPDQTMAAFGSTRYRPRGQEGSEPLIRLRCNAIFGSCEVIEGGSHLTGDSGALSRAAR